MRRYVSAAVLGPMAALVLSAAPAWAQEAAGPPPAPTSRPAAGPNHLETEKLISFNFDRADLEQVLAYLSKVAGVTFLKETSVSGEVNIVNQQQLTVADAFHLLNAVLKIKGATCIVNDTRIVKIVPLSEAKRRDLDVYPEPDLEKLPKGETFVTQVVPLKRAKARDLARELRNLIGSYGDLAALTYSNALAITDTAGNVRKLLRIIQQADSDRKAEGDLRVFTLKHADAKKVADIITKMFADTGRSSNRSPTVITFRSRFRRPSPRTPPSSSSDSGDDSAPVPVRVTVEERLNAVIVTAGADQMRVIEDMIKKIDVAPETARLVCQVVKLEHGDCTEVAKVIEDVFKQSRTSSRSRTTSTTNIPQMGRRTSGSTRGQPTAATTSTGPASEEELKVTTDRRTNRVILVGTPDQVALAVEIIKELTDSEGEQVDMLIIRLKNAKAKDLEQSLRQMFREARQASSRLQAGSSSQRGAAALDTGAPGVAGETVVVANEETNSLMIVSNPRNFPRIEEYVEQLDAAKPQVFIQALIGEITLDDDTQLGIDFNHVDEPFRHGSGTATWRMDFGVSPDLQGGSVAISYRDIELVIHALETEGKLHVLSRPHILTLDNQTATITDGERVPFIQSSRETDEGSILNTITYEDIGIILEVTPQINPDGWVNMEVKQEISRVTGRTVPISSTVDAPTFATRSAITTVSIRDGQTIVIGGLIAESEVTTVEKVPILGDLPLIGAAFQRSVVSKQRKELLLILTPRVVRSEEDLEGVSEKRRECSEFRGKTAEPCGAVTEKPNADAAKKVTPKPAPPAG